MKVAVCAKQIPGPDARSGIDPQSGRFVREQPFVLDDSDSYGVEIALRLVEQAGGGEVTLISMVPDGETEGLTTALAMGTHRAVVVSDPALAGSDALGTAKVLAAAVRRAGAELLVTATESTDGYTGTVPVQVAELLSWPAVSFARHLEISGGTLLAHRQTENGYDEISCPLPAVVSVTAGVVEVRYPSFRGIMAARSKPVEQLGLEELDLAPRQFGAAGARQEVVAVEDAEARASGTIVTDDGAAAEQIVALLESWKVL